MCKSQVHSTPFLLAYHRFLSPSHFESIKWWCRFYSLFQCSNASALWIKRYNFFMTIHSFYVVCLCLEAGVLFIYFYIFRLDIVRCSTFQCVFFLHHILSQQFAFYFVRKHCVHSSNYGATCVIIVCRVMIFCCLQAFVIILFLFVIILSERTHKRVSLALSVCVREIL